MIPVLQIALLPVALLALHAVAFGLAGVGDSTPEVTPSPGSLAIVVVLEAAALVVAAARAGRGGPGLGLALFLAYFGAKSFMSQIESLFFVAEMPTEQVLRVVAAGFGIAAGFSPLVVWATRRWRSATRHTEPRTMTSRPWRWMAVPFVYLGLYFVFGYYVAWSQPEVRAFYGGEDPTGFWPHLGSLLVEDPWLIPFQFLRTGLWTLFAWPLLRRLDGSPLSAGVVLGAVLGIGLTAQLLLANPFMPETVRWLHFVETLPSTWLFGIALGLLLLGPEASTTRPERSDAADLRA